MAKGSSGGKRGGNNNEILKNLKGLSESEQKDFYYHKAWGDAAEYLHLMQESVHYGSKEIVAEAIKEAKKSLNESIKNGDAQQSYILINENLPKLTGTERQIKYANDLRRKALMSEADFLSDSPYTVRRNPSVAKEFFDNPTAKKMGIKTNSDFVNYKFKESKKYKVLSNITSAKKIIEGIKNDTLW